MKRIISIIIAIFMIATSIPLLALPTFAEEDTSYSVGDHIQYGNYPQSKVTDEALLATLDGITKNWISYNYYTGTGSTDDGQMTASNYMKYADIDFDEDGLIDYRAVTFTQYRPDYTGYTSSESNSYQDNNCYIPNEIYYFKYEPISWRILDPSSGLLMSESILDSQAYNNYILGADDGYYGDSSKTYYANDYYNCSIRKWLNEDFYNTAFTTKQKANIRNDVEININSQASHDKVFLLSYDEVKTSVYGFSSSVSAYDTARETQGTDYAKSQGLWVYIPYGTSHYGNSKWWLRSPGYYSDSVRNVDHSGCSYDSRGAYETGMGVRPALRLSNLKSDIAKSSGAEPEASIKKVPSYLSVGEKFFYGSYPQSEVTDSNLISALNSQSGSWISYNYYVEDSQSDYMKYKDVTYSGNKYRAVTFSLYRPYYTSYDSSTGYTNQYDNGYTTGNTYWFKYESLAWRVLDPSTGYVICDTIIDSQAFNNEYYSNGIDAYENTAYYNDETYTHLVNNWKYSTIRAWLNNNFYNTAFSETERQQIPCTKLTTPACSASYSAYDVRETGDYIFLPSYQDMLNTSYGFSPSYNTDDINRRAHASDYAKSQGVYIDTSNTDNSGNYTSYYRLRSAGIYSYCTTSVYTNGEVNDRWDANYTDYGIRPVFCFNPSSIYNADTCGHTETETKNALEATCTTDGYTGDAVCVDCGKIAETGSVIDALGHDYSVLVSAQSDASCATEGVTALYKCSRCDATQGGETIDKLAHAYTDVVTAPTCKTKGYTTHTCSVCEDSYVDSYVDAKGHTPKGAVQEDVVNASCTAEGSYNEVVRCDDCNTVISSTAKIIDKLAHTVVIDVKVDATCTEAGKTEGSHCSVCNTVIKAQETIPATGHTSDSGKVTKQPTCTKEGTKTYSCAVCKVTLKTETMAKLDHNFVKGQTVAPTCTDKGYTNYICSYCGETVKPDSVPAMGHTDLDGDNKCDICGTTINSGSQPDTSNCSCNCHKSGLSGFIYKLQRFFWKLFKTHQVCECGAVHY